MTQNHKLVKHRSTLQCKKLEINMCLNAESHNNVITQIQKYPKRKHVNQQKSCLLKSNLSVQTALKYRALRKTQEQ